jgi:hypothetical protein
MGWLELVASGKRMNGPVEALATHDDGSGPALFAGGSFSVFDSRDGYLAKWALPLDLEPPTLACPPSVLVLDELGSAPGEIVTFSVGASDCRDPRRASCACRLGELLPARHDARDVHRDGRSGNRATCEFPVTVRVEAALTVHTAGDHHGHANHWVWRRLRLDGDLRDARARRSGCGCRASPQCGADVAGGSRSRSRA